MDGSTPPAVAETSLVASIDHLFRQHDRWLRPLLRLRFGSNIADDLAQEAYLRAAPYHARGVLKRPRAMLLRIAANLASNRRRQSYWEINQETGQTAIDKLSISAGQDDAYTVKQIVLALPLELRDVLLLNRVGGMSYQKIADLKGVPLTTVHHWMRKALERVKAAKEELDARG